MLFRSQTSYPDVPDWLEQLVAAALGLASLSHAARDAPVPVPAPVHW